MLVTVRDVATNVDFDLIVGGFLVGGGQDNPIDVLLRHLGFEGRGDRSSDGIDDCSGIEVFSGRLLELVELPMDLTPLLDGRVGRVLVIMHTEPFCLVNLKVLAVNAVALFNVVMCEVAQGKKVVRQRETVHVRVWKGLLALNDVDTNPVIDIRWESGCGKLEVEGGANRPVGNERGRVAVCSRPIVELIRQKRAGWRPVCELVANNVGWNDVSWMGGGVLGGLKDPAFVLKEVVQRESEGGMIMPTMVMELADFVVLLEESNLSLL